jgi:hypothetical protein
VLNFSRKYDLSGCLIDYRHSGLPGSGIQLEPKIWHLNILNHALEDDRQWRSPEDCGLAFTCIVRMALSSPWHCCR